MPYIQLDGLQFPLEVGETRVGSGGIAHIPVAAGEMSAVHAVITVTPDGAAIITGGDGGVNVAVNGVALGETPAPLMHGDRIVVAGRELFFGDDRKTGDTTHVPSMDITSARARPTSARSTAASGGRLVSLVDGREYPVPPAGLVVGRDPTCGVVIPSGEVSRRHAVILPGKDGYT
ncbi:MAG: FHA domain-containing protein, partial [Gemmatimonadaceae bacterium]